MDGWMIFGGVGSGECISEWYSARNKHVGHFIVGLTNTFHLQLLYDAPI